MKSFTREKKIYCGDKYLEVDIYPYTSVQEEVSRRGKRSKRQKVTEPKQKNLNDKISKRYFNQVINANFGEGDLHITLTYSEKFLPESIEEAEKEIGNYLRRVSYRRKKEGLEPLKYVLVTEYKTKKESEKPTRIHHHIITNGGLSRDAVEELWSRRRKKGQKKGEPIGYVNADRLQVGEDGSGITALGKYLTKDPAGKKRWSSSHNLKKPWFRTNDHKYSKREIEKITKDLPDHAFWEKKYPGWTLIKNDYAFKAEYNEVTGWAIYLKMCRLE